ncbi:alpha/beta fold hydrolase [Methylobacterium organophilum]|uniref:4,5:9,10-diseco-3-hydroxy-5,9, 17-trioxoandrosta-1(10),2-diene-4-oate hydrolase n=1 Tax=Methylobacterium organophilum TaxID=410 RepID=A0ABQ4T984_METOR|nr:alpha/beta hydrolase [Methylobacterium organophilum]GJE28230.1 4,5:9,10-diseco-3-hydroxy-5,9, 17-trioxoandrosta-1(10),2-diene-4-oate hydrolase [Methylobacterium organophilum]
MRLAAILGLLGLGLAQLAFPEAAPAQEGPSATTDPALGIALEGFAYPYPVRYLPVTRDGEALRLAYMDVPASGTANGRTALLLHGRNFPSSYWQPVIRALSAAGYRVVAVDQLGFGKSSKPVGAFSFDTMAAETVNLLDRLGLKRVDVVAHSMGGMLALRLARNFPDWVNSLVLEAPIGLEDYRFTVPPVSNAVLLKREGELTADAYRRQLMTSYALSLPESAIEPFVAMRERVKDSGEYPRWLQSFVNSYQAIWGQPVVHEIPLVKAPTLFIMGGNDHNAPGKPYAPAELRAGMGENARNARALAGKMADGRVEVIDGVGHLVHMEATERFNALALDFLNGH